MDRIDDPHYYFYTVQIDDDHGANDIQEKSYYKGKMQRIKKKRKAKYNSSDDNDMVDSSDESINLLDGDNVKVKVGTISSFDIVEYYIHLINE